jgi:hypothetical protein
MPTTTVDSQALRRRALTLRTLADSMATSQAIDLRRRAEGDVWLGPTATRCYDDLTELGRQMGRASDDLVVRARTLERRALELETVAAGAGTR